MAYYSRNRSGYAIVRSSLLAAAVALLALFTSADSWRAALHCSTDSPCIAASDDLPVATGDIAAIVELSDDLPSDGSIHASDDHADKDASAADQILFAANAVTTAATPDRQWRTLFPDKTGPPRA